jgi:predicted enzyme related to lactoylglutathione lyase
MACGEDLTHRLRLETSGSGIDPAASEGMRETATKTTVVTGSPGFISIAVSDAERSAEFYERFLGAKRDTFNFGAGAVAFVGWPTFALNSARQPGQPSPAPDSTSIQLWWRASDAQALYEIVVAENVPILREPFDGPFGRTFVMADPDGYRITIYERDQPLFWPPRTG